MVVKQKNFENDNGLTCLEDLPEDFERVNLHCITNAEHLKFINENIDLMQ